MSLARDEIHTLDDMVDRCTDDKKLADDVHEEDVVANRLPRTPAERTTAIEAARLADPGYPLRSFRAFVFIMQVLVVCCCGGDSGLDATTMSAINGMKQFQAYFGLKEASAKTGIIFGCYTIGGVASFIPGSTLPDLIGRRYTMVAGNLVLILGASLSANATGMSMFLAGRFLTGLGCTTAAIASKAYLAEISAPHVRGRAMGLLNSFYYIGQITASGIAVPLGRRATNWSWRGPLYVQLGFPIINVLCMPFLPESPRYLYAHGKPDQARRVLADLHSANRDIHSPLVNLEIDEIEESISVSGNHKWWDFRGLFSTRSSRYRTYLCLLVSVYGQLSGNGLITYFLTILLRQAGITNQNRILTLNFVNSVTSFIGALIGSAIVDRVGRRTLMLFACITCMSGMLIVCGLLSPAGESSPARATAGVTFIYLFMVCYSLGWTPLQGLYPSEVLSFQNRAKGLAFQTLAAQAVGCINTFGMPPALGKLTWKTYIIFAVLDFIGIFIIYFFAVETKQLSLEELDQLFEAPNPRKLSLKVVRDRRRAARDAHST